MNTKNIFIAIVLLVGIFRLLACELSVNLGNATARNIASVSKSDQKIRNQIQPDENE